MAKVCAPRMPTFIRLLGTGGDSSSAEPSSSGEAASPRPAGECGGPSSSTACCKAQQNNTTTRTTPWQLSHHSQPSQIRPPSPQRHHRFRCRCWIHWQRCRSRHRQTRTRSQGAAGLGSPARQGLQVAKRHDSVTGPHLRAWQQRGTQNALHACNATNQQRRYAGSWIRESVADGQAIADLLAWQAVARRGVRPI
jgi:hypothetical protein